MYAELTTQRTAADQLKVPRYVVWVVTDIYAIPTVACPGNAKGKCYTRDGMAHLERAVQTWDRNRKRAAELKPAKSA